MKTLIVGMGQVGSALSRVLSPHYEVKGIDKGEEIEGTFDILHICFSYFEGFEKEVKRYQEKYKPDYTVIHSTVPVGTSRKCGAIHSPIRGIHPNLESGIRTFVKFIGGEKASEVADYFRRVGMKVYLFDKPETTELMKILSTDFYAVLIEYTKQVKRHCDEYKVPFSAWTLWTDTYNDGYKKLGYPEYTRPNLIPIMKKIGGHCILENLQFVKNEFTKLVNKLNR
jgi:hypothetical protein